MSVNNKNYIIGVLSLLAVILCIFPVWSLISGNNTFIESRLVKLDSIRLLSRAYWDRGTGNKASSFSFEDEKGKTFILNESYTAVNDLRELNDTLQYSRTVLEVYTDSTGYLHYKDAANHDRIEVFGLKIGGKDYISQAEMKRKSASDPYFHIGIILVFYLLILGAYLIDMKRKNSIS